MSGASDPFSAIFLAILTVLFPPIGVAIVAGCGPDLLINLLLTFFGFFPGHIHAFYILYVYYRAREDARHPGIHHSPAPGIFSERVQTGGYRYAGPPAPAAAYHAPFVAPGYQHAPQYPASSPPQYPASHGYPESQPGKSYQPGHY